MLMCLGRIIDYSLISYLTLKLYVFIRVISLTTGKVVSIPCKNNGKDREFSDNLKLFELGKKPEDNFIAKMKIHKLLQR